MAWVKSTVNSYATMYETFDVADSAGANVVTTNLTTLEDGVDGYFCGNKFPIIVAVTEASAGDGAWDVKVQVSADGTTFVDADASTISDLDPTGTNTATALADLSNIYAPYVRFAVFTDGTDTQDAAAGKLTVAVPGYGTIE